MSGDVIAKLLALPHAETCAASAGFGDVGCTCGIDAAVARIEELQGLLTDALFERDCEADDRRRAERDAAEWQRIAGKSETAWRMRDDQD